MKLAKLIEDFLSWAKSALKPRTVMAYEYQLGKLLKEAGDVAISKLRPLHVSSWAKKWHEVQAAQRLMNWAQKEARVIKENPFADCKLPPRGQRQRTLNRKEMTELLRSCQRPGRHLLLAIRETFGRPQEIRAAKFDQLRSGTPGVSIECALQKGDAIIVQHDFKDRARRANPSAPRILLVNRRLGRLILRIMLRRHPEQQYLFLNTRGKPWTKDAVRCLLRRARKRLCLDPDERGENYVAYSFRHSQATLAAASGMSDSVLASILGHVDTRTTKRYQHLHVGHLRDALNAFQQSKRLAG